MSNILVLQRQSPFNSSRGREALDMILAFAAVEHSVSILFSGDAVYQLLSITEHNDFKLKTYPRSFKLFGLYDIEHVYACQHALETRGIDVSSLTIDAVVVDAAAQANLLLQQDRVISS